MKIHRVTNRAESRLGVAVVEFAAIAGVLFLLIAACFEFHRVMMLRQVADTATYEAARTLIVPGAKVADGEALANRLLRGASVRDFTFTIDPSTISESTTTVKVAHAFPWIPTHGLLPSSRVAVSC